MHYLTIGVLAHVDAGKTTLSEALLYTAGAIRKAGRVDSRDTVLDSDEIERKRGITIVAKQAILPLDDMQITLLDTPGHVDFVAQTQRAIAVMDYAVLVISASEGVQSHTLTLWNLLQKSKVPTFVFFNKVDLMSESTQKLLLELKAQCSENCVDFTNVNISEDISGDIAEQLALCDENLMNDFLHSGKISKENIARAINERNIFPCYFGSALKFNKIEQFLGGLRAFVKPPVFDADFGAYVYKINNDENGVRLTHLKITGGSLQVKQQLSNEENAQKINELRLYTGAKYEVVKCASAGMICAVTGLTHTRIGQGFGSFVPCKANAIEPVFTYKVVYQNDIPSAKVFEAFKELEQEEPDLHVEYSDITQEITISVMGEVGLEVLQTRLKQRFNMNISFESGKIIYKETISKPVFGVGHFEPLRHYAEVYLKLEPLKQGTGIVLEEGELKSAQDMRYMQLILTHLREKEHIGALTGSAITDIKITVVGLIAHLKHTQGGDFRQATYRAVRQALRTAQSENKAVLLEPYYAYKLQIPTQHTGKAMTDLQRMNASISAPLNLNDTTILTGLVPVSGAGEYFANVAAYTKGLGKFTCVFHSYAQCKNAQDIIQSIAYDADADLSNTADSVFCTHGAGYTVPWQEAQNYMHIERRRQNAHIDYENIKVVKQSGKPASDKELLQIYERTYGPIKQRNNFETKPAKKNNEDKESKKTYVKNISEEQYLLVDGYNIIFAWDVTKKMAQESLESARKYLIDRLCNYKGLSKAEIIVVFDAYKVKNGVETSERVNNINVVYTKEAETADMYIEKITKKIAKTSMVRVASSDALEQMIILGHGALRMSAQMLLSEIENTEKMISEFTIKV